MEHPNLNEKDTQDVDRSHRPSTEGEVQPPDSTEVEKTYPPKKIVLPTMIALFLVFFLVALVSQIQRNTLLSSTNNYSRTVPL